MSQSKKMIADCESTKLTEITPSAEKITTESVDKWSQIATRFVAAIALVAKELGQTVNEFLPTPAGLIAATLIIWQVMGDDIIGGLKCIMGIWLGLFWMSAVRMYIKSMLFDKVEKEERKFLWFTFTKDVKKYKSYSDLDSDNRSGYDVIYVLGHCVGFVIILISILNF